MYLRVAFLHHIHAANVCEKFVNCERIFLYEPCKKKQMLTKVLKVISGGGGGGARF